ncbi:mechanosensitive ion channel family protein [Pseudodesulfovibrio cashew]|uniref:mechanosensitive ion channel family protein n=1 Tax=Pseudodesulfovibrio cashew TaxID=2678688 RepID=UPI001F558C22|nr:mechanosensitive ion channel domain-containing protein [Pseudodesulfovibrio cashew]
MKELFNNPYVLKTAYSLGLALVLFLLARLAGAMTRRRGGKPAESGFVIKYAGLSVFALCLVFIWMDGLGPIVTVLSVVAAALTIVSKELILNFLGSFVILWRELFAIGDRVQVGDCAGDVIDKGLFYFTLLEVGNNDFAGHSTGRLIKVPNSLALTLPVINATRGAGYVWNEIGVTITRESDREAARDALLATVGEYYAREGVDLERVKRFFETKGVFFRKTTPRVYLGVVTGGFRLTLRYLCSSRMSRESGDFILTGFVDRCPELGVELAQTQE